MHILFCSPLGELIAKSCVGASRLASESMITEMGKYFIEIITACNKIIYFKIKIDWLTADISKTQSKRDILEKTQYEKKVWLEY